MIHLTNARLIDPEAGTDAAGSITLQDGLITAINSTVPKGALVMIGLFFVLSRSIRARKAASVTDRRYLLTNRAAYLARVKGQGLMDMTAYPITPALQLGLGPRSVSFATERDAKGNPTPVGFLDIPDAPAVHAIIRDPQKGQA